MFGYNAKRSLVDIINELNSIESQYKNANLKGLITKLQAGGRDNANCKDIDKKIEDLITQYIYNLNDNNERTCKMILSYLEKLIDSRKGFGNYYEELKKENQEELQKRYIEAENCLDKADKYSEAYHKETNKLKKPLIESKYKLEMLNYETAIKTIITFGGTITDAEVEVARVLADKMEQALETHVKNTVEKGFHEDRADRYAQEHLATTESIYGDASHIAIPPAKEEEAVPTETTKKLLEEGE